MLAQFALAQAVTFALIVTRLGGFIVVSPFPGEYVNSTVRIGLVLLLAWVVTLFAPEGPSPHDLGVELMFTGMSEAAIGLAIGATFRFVFSAVDLLGQVLAQATGIAVPQVMNPSTESQDTVIGKAITLFAMLVVIGTGTHRVVFGYLLESFRALPVGSGIQLASSASTFVDLAYEAIAVGVRLAMPAIAVGLVVQSALAMLSRAAPSLQIFSVGLGLVICCGFAVLITSLPDIQSGLGEHFGHLAPHLDDVLRDLRGAP